MTVSSLGFEIINIALCLTKHRKLSAPSNREWSVLWCKPDSLVGNSIAYPYAGSNPRQRAQADEKMERPVSFSCSQPEYFSVLESKTSDWLTNWLFDTPCNSELSAVFFRHKRILAAIGQFAFVRILWLKIYSIPLTQINNIPDVTDTESARELDSPFQQRLSLFLSAVRGSGWFQLFVCLVWTDLK